LQVASDQVKDRSRLADSGGSAAGGFGLVNRSVDARDVTSIRRRYGASFDEYAMASLHMAVARWNRDHDAPCDVVGVTQGVNLREDDWWDDVVVNLAAFTSVLSRPPDRETIGSALACVRLQLDPAVRVAHARQMAAAARAVRVMPADLRAEALRTLPDARFDTCTISNLGPLADAPRLSDHGESLAWIVTPAMPVAGLTIATYVLDDELRFDVCFRRERFDLAAAEDFVDAFIATLLAR
jgi:NRPS condensation-like uncharacterized protein